MGDPSRFRVVVALIGGERCVGDLAIALGRSQSCTTRHLQALGREGLVRGRREGKRVMFRLVLEDPKVAGLVQWATSPARRQATARARAEGEALIDHAVTRESHGPATTELEHVGAPVTARPGEAAERRAQPETLDVPEPEAVGPRRPNDLEDFLL
jgi:DNA-binding transcriptional ArsR family regulator